MLPRYNIRVPLVSRAVRGPIDEYHDALNRFQNRRHDCKAEGAPISFQLSGWRYSKYTVFEAEESTGFTRPLGYRQSAVPPTFVVCDLDIQLAARGKPTQESSAASRATEAHFSPFPNPKVSPE